MYCVLQTFLFFQFIFIDSCVLNKMFLFKFRRVTKQRKTAKVNRRKKFTLLLFLIYAIYLRQSCQCICQFFNDKQKRFAGFGKLTRR